MAKQMKRVEKRYVPQQESFRQLPGLRPQAEPQAAVATQAPDSGAERLRELAESLAIGNKALQDFFTMEKSFEETNRVANRTRAMLGLPQAEGPGGGLLDWGSDYGYQEGSGLAQGISLKEKLLQDLDNQNFFIDESNPDPQSTMNSMNSYVQKFINDNVGEQQNNPAFMAGVSKYLVEARVEAMVTASNRLEALKLQRQLGNYGTWATSMFTQELPKAKSPQDVREVLSRLTAESSRFGISRDAAADHLASTLSSQYEGLFTQAHDNDDIEGMDNTLKEMSLLSQALDLPDSAGVPFGGVLKDANGKLQQPLAPTKRELQTGIRQMIIDRERAIDRINKKTVADNSASLLYRLQGNEINISQAISETNKLYGKIPSESYLELQKFLNEVDRSDMDIVEKPGLYEELLLNIKSVSLDTLRKHVALGDLKPSTATYLAAERQRILTEETTRLTIANKQASLRNTNLRNKQLQEKADKENVFSRWFVINGAKYPAAMMTSVKSAFMNLEGATPETLDALAEGQAVLVQQKERLAEVKRTKAAEAKLESVKKVNDFIINNPEYGRYASTLQRLVADPRHSTTEGMLMLAVSLDYPRVLEQLEKRNKAKTTPKGSVREAVAAQSEIYGKLTDDQKNTLASKLRENPAFEVPYTQMESYFKDIERKQKALLNYPRGSEMFDHLSRTLELYTILAHPLSSEDAKRQAGRYIEEINNARKSRPPVTTISGD